MFNIAHSIITLAILLISFYFGNPFYGACIASAFYIGREFAQAEERIIDDVYKKRENAPWYCGFMVDAWTEKGLLDWIIPLVISIIFCWIYTIFWR